MYVVWTPPTVEADEKPITEYHVTCETGGRTYARGVDADATAVRLPHGDTQSQKR